MKIYENLDQIIGNTPLLNASRYAESVGANADILLKLEGKNPGGSVKDRTALGMINAAEAAGLLKHGSVIIEPTSGNTGIGLAAVAAARGYKTIIVMPDTMSKERRMILSAYGAELVLTDGALGMSGAIDKAKELCENYSDAFIPSQFDNPANPGIHYDTTGPEIWNDTDGTVDIFVAGVGTGGTVSGIGRYLKEKNKNVKIVAVEPKDSPLLSGGKAAPHAIQGIGANFIPGALDMSVVDDVISVSADDSYNAVRTLVRTEGVLAGISSGAALHAATVLAKRAENQNKRIVVLLPDGGEKYLSTGVYN